VEQQLKLHIEGMQQRLDEYEEEEIQRENKVEDERDEREKGF
jgi:hypothetical protein